jgi:transposase
MLTVDTIGRIRRAHFIQGKKIKAIARELKVSRNTVREIIRAEATEHRYKRAEQPRPQLGPHIAELDALLEANEVKVKRERLTFKRMHAQLKLSGYGGGYDAVRRYARAWQRLRGVAMAEAYVPLIFAPGEAYEFDWSHEFIILAGVTTPVKLAHMRLAYSRMAFLRLYPRESQEMVFDAHDRAFRFFKGACVRGIYDNMKTAVDTVFVGKERVFNRRFLQMTSHYLVEPTACTPGAGWEKGQVENQVGTLRKQLFAPYPRFETLDAANAWLLDQCVRYAKAQPHPELKDKTVFEVFEAERNKLIHYRGPFDGFHAKTLGVSKTCLVRFDNNKYSVMAKAVGRPVDVYAYADRIVVKQNGEIVGEHARRFGRDQTAYNPWHYVPVLARKPGALRNGAPFKQWPLPDAIEKVRAKLTGTHDGDRQMVKILSAVLTDGLSAVEAACAEAIDAGIASADVILNVLARSQQPKPAAPIEPPERLLLTLELRADCARYDSLRSLAREAVHGAA